MSSVAPPRTLVELCTSRARSHGNAVALDDGHRVLTYAGFAEHVVVAARLLRSRGVGPGDRVLLVGRNSTAWVVAAFGVFHLGATVVPLGHGVPAVDRRRAVERLRPVAVVADPGAWSSGDPELPLLSTEELLEANGSERLGELPDVVPTTPAIVLATSGTTGSVKYVPMTHGQLTTLYTGIASRLGLRAEDRLLCVVPLAHSFGFNGVLLIALCVGAAVRLVGQYDAARLPELVAAERLTVLAGPPTIYYDLHLAKARFAEVRLAITGSTEVETVRMRAICDDLGIAELVSGYGMTETCGSVAIGRIGPEPGEHAWLELLEGIEARAEAGPGSSGGPGRLRVRGYNVLESYADSPERVVDADGWFDTGDLALIDDQGRLAIVSRLKDTVIVSGFNVLPQEVERVLVDHPAVAHAVVVGVPDQRQGERLVACVVVEGVRPTEESLRVHLREHLAAYKVPGTIVYVDELPTTSTGKVLRAVVRERLMVARG
ncbi:AMP-binding protein [Nocardioides daejeonensis]|uniref:AMP-binding protein n=1 Tax=Nocardioides daejeonensis TaxID=1046556 RepID=UPI0013A568AE|nr:AMP-binding protein [Nocardioides daejeonensis]